MSEVLTPEVVTLPVPPRPFVASDIEHIPWDGRRWEVIDGMLVVSPSHLTVTPLLVVEVLSLSNPALDTALKRQRYEALGVPAYWMVDPASPGTLVSLRLVDGIYEEVAGCSGEDAYDADFPFSVRVVPSSLVP